MCNILLSCAPHAGGTIAQVAIAWLLHQSAVSSVVIGARTVEQLEDNIKGALLPLSAEQVSAVYCMRGISSLSSDLHSVWEGLVHTIVLTVGACVFLQVSALNKASAEALPYPYEMVFRLQKGRERTPPS